MMQESYLEKWVNTFFNESEHNHYMYENHIKKFIDYVNLVGKENSIMDINENDLKKSVGYQNSLGNIRTIPSMNNHLEAIKAFYTFLQKKRVYNNIFNLIPDYSEFKNDIANTYNLSQKVNRLALPNEVGIQLLKYFDNEIFDKNDGYMLIKIYSKLSLIAPAKRQVLLNLTLGDFDKDFRWVIVNTLKIKINNSLRRDILKALERNQNYRYNNEDLFFEVIYRKAFDASRLNSYMYKVLRDIDYLEETNLKNPTFSVEPIMNMALLNMVKSNLNPLLIARINGVTIGTIEEKISKLCKDGVNKVLTDDSLINDSISSLEYYQYI